MNLFSFCLRLGARRISACCAGVGAIACYLSVPATAQLIGTDQTLSTRVSTSDNTNFTIERGDLAGSNLFHSFDTFSIPTNGSAVFSNSADITNIISRVTGNTLSRIDGTIKTNGSANFFLLNPSGIVFGANAQLDIGGSFVGSTAESLHFSEGALFLSKAIASPLLSISTPTGLQLGSASQSIQVNDAGYRILSDLPLRLDSSSALQVRSGNTLALVGSNLNLQGGTLAAAGGHIALGSVKEGLVTIDSISDSAGSPLSYQDVKSFGDIELSNQALLNTSDLLFGSASPQPIAAGSSGGSIQLQGRRLLLTDGSIALTQNFSRQNFGSIRVNASETIELKGEDKSQKLGSGFVTTSFGSGPGGDVNITAPQLLLIGDGNVLTETFGSAPSGKISVATSERIQSRIEAGSSGNLTSISYGSGDAGDINISTSQLSLSGGGVSSRNVKSGLGGTVYVSADHIFLTEGASLASATVGEGAGGDVLIDATTINIIGVYPQTFFPSTIAASTTSSGNAGNVTVNTQQLTLQAGGRVDSSTFAAGDAGTITINAAESVTATGRVPGSINPSLISSSANTLDPVLRKFLESIGIFVPLVPSGAAGDVTINTPSLTVREGAQVTVRNDGSGDGGLLTVNADQIKLQAGAGITASTLQGEGGNIVLIVRDGLLLRSGSRLSAEAGGVGDGGNITLTSPVVVALEDSDIIANATQGAGGNIQINTQGLLGTRFRDQLTPESDITASSQFGVSGQVEISNLEATLHSGINALPQDVTDSSDQIVVGCSVTQDNQFIASGRGGLLPDPTRDLEISRLWQDVRTPSSGVALEVNLERSPATTTHKDHQRSPSESVSLVEATAIGTDAQGKIALVLPTTQLATYVPNCHLR